MEERSLMETKLCTDGGKRRVTLETPIEALTWEQKSRWVPRAMGYGLAYWKKLSVPVNPDVLAWRLSKHGVLLYLPEEKFFGQIARHLPGPQMLPWAAKYLSLRPELRLWTAVAQEQPLRAVRDAARELYGGVLRETWNFLAVLAMTEGLRRAGLMRYEL